MSERGFQFLLVDLYSQLWSVLRQYLDDLPAAGSASASASASPELPVAINFLFRLGLQAGEPMCYSQLGEAEQAIAAHMAQLGLLMPVSAAGELWLHPTRLAAVLAGGGRAGEAGAAAAEDGFVIVESNFRWVGDEQIVLIGVLCGGLIVVH
jgi:transcription initiation factor TFIIH subunit 4